MPGADRRLPTLVCRYLSLLSLVVETDQGRAQIRLKLPGWVAAAMLSQLQKRSHTRSKSFSSGLKTTIVGWDLTSFLRYPQ